MKNEINNMNRLRQPVIFKGINFETIFPTDVDGLIEYKNKAYIFFDLKYKEKDIPIGQKIAFERLVNDTSRYKDSIALIIEHEEFDTNKPIIVKDCCVRELYHSSEKRWRKPIPDKLNAYTAMKMFIQNVEQIKRTDALTSATKTSIDIIPQVSR